MEDSGTTIGKATLPRNNIAIVFLMLFASVFFGCDGDDGENSNPDSGPVDSDLSAVDVLTSATPGGIGLLTETHEGWGQGPCLSCHQNNHLDGFPVAACSHCHGRNGAPSFPENHGDDGCSNSSCHESQHAPISLSPPNDCRSCHTYASTASAKTCTHTANYDVVVIGAGGGGLAAATKLAREGENVLLVEQHYKPGGCMVTFDRGDYSFEASLHAMDGLAVNTFKELAIDDDITMLASDKVMYKSVYPDFSLDVPADIAEYQALLKEKFPDQVAGIDKLFDAIVSMDFSRFEGSMADAMASNNITDERLIAVLTVLSGFLAGGPEDLPASLYLAMLWGYHVSGYVYLEGGSQSVSDALASEFQAAGGTLKFHTKATKIVIEDGLATQVQTENGGCYNTSHVISNANLPDTYLKMVGEENLPEEAVQKVKTTEPAPTFATMYLGVNHDYTDLFPENAHEIFVLTSYETDYSASVKECDAENVGFGIGNYTTLDPTNAPPGKNVIAISIPLAWECNEGWQWDESYADYNEYKAEIADIYIKRAEAFLPDLSAHIEVMEMATPRTIAAYTLNPKGTWAGYGILPGSTGMEFMEPEAHRTPIDNLHMAGAWAGVAGQSVALTSGLSAAKLILEAE